MVATQVALTFAEALTGILLTEAGSRAEASNAFRPTFKTRGEAEPVLARFLDRYPHSECVITSSDGTTSRRTSPKLSEWFNEKREWERWRGSGWLNRWLNEEPEGRYFRARSNTCAVTPTGDVPFLLEVTQSTRAEGRDTLRVRVQVKSGTPAPRARAIAQTPEGPLAVEILSAPPGGASKSGRVTLLVQAPLATPPEALLGLTLEQVG
ncbi:MAG: hypothetical protein JKY65_05775 [Planctomycetes bacterium]|nr:hypothetical protein [Planctomycetota bacterium]